MVNRYLKDWLDTLPKNPQRDSFLFETALNGRALMVGTERGRGGSAAADEFTTVNLGFATGRAGGFGGGGGKGAANRTGLQRSDNGLADESAAAPAPVAAGEAADKADPSARPELQLMEADFALQVPEEEATKLGTVLDAKAEAKAESRFGRGLTLEKAGKAIELRRKAAGKAERFFRQVDQTKEWAENNYYRLLLAQQTPDLVQPNRFWQDYALWDGARPFLSSHLAEASGSFTEMLLALAALDLPFPSQVKTGKVERKDNAIILTPAGRSILFHQEIRSAEEADGRVKLLVSQNFYRQGDRSIEQAGEKTDKFVTGEFLSGVVYGCQVVVTNPSSSRQKLDLLFQIPQGAIPVLATQVTRACRFPLNLITHRPLIFNSTFRRPASIPTIRCT